MQITSAAFVAGLDPANDPHRRYNPLTGQWVLVSPHRAQRPWSGQDAAPAEQALPSYEPKCFLCPTNTRISGDVNPDYAGTYVFSNDFAALKTDTPQISAQDNPLFQTQGVRGLSRVICFSPDHS
ncbi:MAG: galactose-1-phosphate uridylyltransferase, partial [Plesiomonas shigelloides]